MPRIFSAICVCVCVSVSAAAQGRWTTETRLPRATQETSVVALDGQVWVAAGSLNQTRTNALWSYDPATQIWTSHAPYPGSARDHAGIAVVGTSIYLIGGLTAWPSPSVATVQRYDPGTNAWTALAPLPVARGAMGVAAINGRIYAAGGLVSGSSVNDFTVYDPATNAWTNLPDMPTPRDHLAAAVVDGKLYAIGGRLVSNTCAPMNIVEIFDPATNTWTSGPPMQHAHGGHAIGTVDGHIQVFGGEGSADNCGTIAESEDFNPATNTWTSLPNMPTPRHGIGGATIGTTVYLPGGATWKGDSATAVDEKYDTTGTPTAGPVPSPWTAQDIGSVGIAGEEQYDNGVFTIRAAGANIYNSADSFRFVYQPLTGDGQIVARIDSLGFTSRNAKAGIMIRETLAANSRHVVLDSQPDDTVEFMSRASTGAAVTKLIGAAGAEPIWLKLVRVGSTITAFTAADGGTWTPTGSTSVALPVTVYAGLAVSSHLTTKMTSATIDHVAVLSASGNKPPTVSIASPSDNAAFTAPATINIAATASDPDGTIARVDLYANAALISSDAATPYTFSWRSVPAGRYTLTAVATDNSDAQTTSLPVTVTVTTAPPSGSLPSPWQNADVGSVGIAGGASFSNGVFSLKGSGADIWNAADAFQFAYQTLNGDGQIVARVATVQNVNVWTKAEVMIRNTLDPGSAFASMLVSPAKGVQFQWRSNISGTAAGAAGSASTAPRWIKVVRTGNVIAGYESSDGSAWTQVGSHTLTIGPNVLIGLAVTSHDNSKAATATFDNVAVTQGVASPGGLPAPWADQDIGSVGKAGNAAYSNGVFTVQAAGANVWSTADSFNFVSQAVQGDGSMVARITSLQNTDVHAKAGVMFRESLATASREVILDVEPSGRIELMHRDSTGGITSTIANATATFPVWLKLARSGSTLTASVSANGTTWSTVGTTTSAIPSAVFIGLATTSHNVTVLTTAQYSNVAATGAPISGPIIPDPSTPFNRKTIVVGGSTPTSTAVAVPAMANPTTLALGPDGRLYAAGMNGKIFAITLDPTKVSAPNVPAVTKVQEIDNIYLKPSIVCDANGLNCTPQPPPGTGRQVTGIVIDPASTSADIRLYVTHSGMSKGKTDMTLYTYGGQVTRLTLKPSAADPSTLAVAADEDLIVGLSRSREAHALNGMDFGPDGWLYFAVGGNTNAGAPSTFFANLPEYYLAAAVLRLNVNNLAGTPLPLDATGVKSAADMTMFANKLELYATGYRNPYDIVWHSNGKLYLNGNAPNLNQGNTPGTADGCSTPSIDVGTKKDTLNIVTKGAYGGHPAPIRGQCVWGDGTDYPSHLPPEPGYRKPIASYFYPSADGVAEYTSTAFNGAMKGHLITAVYAGDQNLRDVVLTADGTGVVTMKPMGQFSNPLDVAVDKNGVIYVAEFGSSSLTLMIPTQLASCPVPGSNPATTDSDKDGYTDADEQSNGTDMCSAASTPADFDDDHVSNLLDSDDDGDGIADSADQLFFDASNGSAAAIPLALEWNPGDGDYGGVAHSGFTGSQLSSHGTIDQASGHALVATDIHPGDAGGHMTVWTESGTAEGATNTQMNALQIGFDSSSDFRIWSRITEPFTGATPAFGHVGGIFFGPNQDNYVRIAMVGTAFGGTALTVAVEINAAFTEMARIDLSSTTISNLDVFLIGKPGTTSVTAYYDLNTSGTMTPAGGAITVPAGWFSNNAGTAPNSSLTGVMVSDGGAAQMAFVYDFFRIDRAVP